MLDISTLQSIPFNKAGTVGLEAEYIAKVIESGRVAGDGPFTQRCHALLEDLLGVPKVLLTTSCTAALEMSALLLNVQAGDEVILPSFTFVSTANAFVLRGARPVFCDIRLDTLNLDEEKLEALVTPRTKAIVPVHYAGVGCAMDAILSIAQRHNLAVVEDNAHGMFGKYRGRNLGTFGCLATQSFHETKNFTCGEGGALLINDPTLTDRAEILREKGTNRARFVRGQVDKYSWVDIGSSFLPSDLLAAFLLAQLEGRDIIQAARRRLWERYAADLAGWALENSVSMPAVPSDCAQAYHMFYLLLPSLPHRQAMIAHLKTRRIQAVFHYLPLHLSAMGRKFGGRRGDCPVTEEVSDRLLRLPFFTTLAQSERERVIEAVTDYQCSAKKS
jgi:dTDP-4-amino-4,6-dideoxygalactose transaminase